jgi:hypothetical protein
VTKRRFYAFVWRANALMIFAVGAGCLLGLLFAAFMAFKSMSRPRHLEDTINISEGQVGKTDEKLGKFSAIEGSAMLRAPLHLEQEYAGLHNVSKGTSAIQNYLYFDPASHASHWLINGNGGLILDTRDLPARNYGAKEEAAVEAVFYALVDTDSNGDGKLTDADQMTIAISDPNGKHFVRLFSKVDGVNSVHLSGKGALVVLYTAGKQLHAADVDLNSGKVVRESVVKS